MLKRMDAGVMEECEALGVRMRETMKAGLEGVDGVHEVRGLGLLVGVELESGLGVAVAEAALKRGVMVLPAGEHGEVVELSPPVTLTRDQEAHALQVLVEAIREVAG